VEEREREEFDGWSWRCLIAKISPVMFFLIPHVVLELGVNKVQKGLRGLLEVSWAALSTQLFINVMSLGLTRILQFNAKISLLRELIHFAQQNSESSNSRITTGRYPMLYPKLSLIK
jgi:hypothetical protein